MTVSFLSSPFPLLHYWLEVRPLTLLCATPSQALVSYSVSSFSFLQVIGTSLQSMLLKEILEKLE